MKTMFAKAGLALALGATALTAAVPAQAQRYWGHRGHDNTGTAIVAGVAGLAIGAAIASSAHRDRYYDNGYYDQGYYDGGYYGPAYAYDGYYRAPPRVYYDRGYYDRRDYRRYDDRGGYYRGGYGHYGYDRGGYGYRR